MRGGGGKRGGESGVVQMRTTTVVNYTHVSTATYVMYEQGLRLGREAPGLKSLQKQVWTPYALNLFVCSENLSWGGGGGGGGEREKGCIVLQTVITSPS